MKYSINKLSKRAISVGLILLILLNLIYAGLTLTVLEPLIENADLTREDYSVLETEFYEIEVFENSIYVIYYEQDALYIQLRKFDEKGELLWEERIQIISNESLVKEFDFIKIDAQSIWISLYLSNHYSGSSNPYRIVIFEVATSGELRDVYEISLSDLVLERFFTYIREIAIHVGNKEILIFLHVWHTDHSFTYDRADFYIVTMPMAGGEATISPHNSLRSPSLQYMEADPVHPIILLVEEDFNAKKLEYKSGKWDLKAVDQCGEYNRCFLVDGEVISVNIGINEGTEITLNLKVENYDRNELVRYDLKVHGDGVGFDSSDQRLVLLIKNSDTSEYILVTVDTSNDLDVYNTVVPKGLSVPYDFRDIRISNNLILLQSDSKWVIFRNVRLNFLDYSGFSILVFNLPLVLLMMLIIFLRSKNKKIYQEVHDLYPEVS